MFWKVLHITPPITNLLHGGYKMVIVVFRFAAYIPLQNFGKILIV